MLQQKQLLAWCVDMPTMIPTSVSRPKPYLLSIVYPDGFTAVLLLSALRGECPCALCKGEEVMGQMYMAPITIMKPGMNELSSLTPVGNYGLQAAWNDGHNTGIYSWDNLYDIARRHALDQKQIEELAIMEQ